MFKFNRYLLFAVSIFILISSIIPITIFSKESKNVENDTTSISIKANVNKASNKINIKYFVAEKFNKPSHGIFLVLPKNQDGVWTEYKVTKTIIATSNKSCDIDCAEILTWTNEKYEIINEWNQFRVRIGDKDKLLPRGYYFYGIEIEANYNPNLAYNFIFLENWGENILNNDIRLSFNGAEICTNKGPYPDYYSQALCDENKTSFLTNPSQPKSSLFLNIWLTVWPYLLLFVLANLAMFYLWFNFAKDNWGKEKLDKPEFEPPTLYPWQSSYLINEGQIDLKNTLLSYILWLNNKKYISLNFNLEENLDPNLDGAEKDLKTNSESEIALKILKDLPENIGLPAIYNETITSISELGMKDGIMSSKINPAEHLSLTQTEIKKGLSQFYKVKPINQPIGWAFGIIFIVFLIGLAIFSLLQNIFLVGNSWGGLMLGGLIFIAPGLTFVLIKWAKLNQKGVEITAYSKRYKYYLENVEKLKLDFSNNPKEGVQKYLVAVPFAASFGVLPKFQKYFANIIPNSNEINSTGLIYSGYYALAFYTPPSSNGGGSGGGGGGFSGGGGSW